LEKVEHKGEGWEPKVVAFVCSWCSSLGADQAGAEQGYPAGVRVVRVPCAGRINPMYVVKALQNGADGVLVFGCHPGDCHYRSGNLTARRRLSLLKSFLAHLGIESERVQVCWISGAEGARFSAMATKVVEDTRRLGPAKKLVKAKVKK
jgi:F420-non-reducing hydrogenase iron-sulfur subunit